MQHFIVNINKRGGNHVKNEKTIHYANNEEDLFSMENLRQKTTGLPMVIWVSEKQGSHSARIKVGTTHSEKINLDETVSISISNPPVMVASSGLSNKDLQLVSEFIKRNEKLLLDYWNKEIDTGDLITNLIKLDS